MIETAVRVEVKPSEDYAFVAQVANNNFYELVYREHDMYCTTISFASLLEMEAVANAMLKAVECARS